MKHRVLISVIIPTRGNPAGLMRCLQALADQTLQAADFEVIIVENVNRYPEPFPPTPFVLKRLFEPIPGSYRARNRGITQARGRYLAFTDDDCLPDPEWLRKGCEFLADYPDRVAGGKIELSIADYRNYVETYEFLVSFDQRHYIEQGNFSATANLMCKAKTMQKVGVFLPDLLSGGDVEWGCRASRLGYVIQYLPQMRVVHPARNRFQTIRNRTIRIARGKIDCRRVGALVPHPLKGTHRQIRILSRLKKVLQRSGPGVCLKALCLGLYLRYVELRAQTVGYSQSHPETFQESAPSWRVCP